MRQAIGGALIAIGAMGCVGFLGWSTLLVMASGMSDSPEQTNGAGFFACVGLGFAVMAGAGVWIAKG